jgi:hypothetical protein
MMGGGGLGKRLLCYDNGREAIQNPEFRIHNPGAGSKKPEARIWNPGYETRNE